ncbi:hypothetical protein PUN28_001619 [Cardiocondyla obscurior]|uniref:Uncharacterized protein n=1 Tax=Cardiocondyla obscurior TaxID=286306 RepID=A0AAW2GQC3_9HYME
MILGRGYLQLEHFQTIERETNFLFIAMTVFDIRIVIFKYDIQFYSTLKSFRKIKRVYESTRDEISCEISAERQDKACAASADVEHRCWRRTVTSIGALHRL